MTYLKRQNGVTGVDASVAVLIIILFVGLISTLFYNVYISNVSTQRATLATNYTIDILEKAQMAEYNDLVIENVDTLIKQINGLENIESKIIEDETIKKYEGTIQGFTIQIQIQKYNEMPGNEDKQDIIKIITVTTTYPVGNGTGAYEVSRAIIK